MLSETPILATKLHIPQPRPTLVHRPRLTERLNQGLHSKLTLISAPAGFGKTTLVSAWVNGRLENKEWKLDKAGAVESTMEQNFHFSSTSLQSPKVAWLSLDERDGDPIRFLSYLITALQTTIPELGEGVLSLIQSSQPPLIEAVLTALLNEIAAIPDHFILVLDDYHVLDAQAVDDALTFLVDHLPPKMHLAITTREDPNLPLARYRVRGQLTEVRAADLRFTFAEATGFLNQAMGLSLMEDEIAALESRTEGWIAGLQMAALSMQGRPDTASFIQTLTGSHRFVLDYLAQEVLQRQSDDVRSFLLQTAILERLSGPLCDAVTNHKTGKEMLAHLEQSNLFVIPLDDERRWYRYHHLFADVLVRYLQEEQPDSAPTLHWRASVWYEQHEQQAEAIRHALAAEDFARVATLIELAWPAMRRNREETTLLRWFQVLPDAFIRVRPVLSVIYAWVLLDGNEVDAVERRLQDAERWLDAATDTSRAEEMLVADEAQFRSLPASIANARAYHAQARGDASGTIKYARQALDLLPEDDHYERGTAAAFLGLAYWTNGDLEAAYDTFADGLTALQMGGGTLSAIGGTGILAHLRIAQGRLHEATAIYEQSLHRAAALDEPIPLATADLHRGLSEIYRERGDWENAVQQLQRSEELGKQAATLSDQYHRLVAWARLREVESDFTGALDLLHQAERIYYMIPIPDVYPVAALKTRVWIRQGRLAEAWGWARERGLSADDNLSYLREYEHITLARILIAQYKHDRIERTVQEALGLLAHLLEAAEAGDRMRSVIEILVLQALAHGAQGDLPFALAPLERALVLAEPEGYSRIFVDEGTPMAQLLSATAQRGILPAYISKLRATFQPSKMNVEPSITSASPHPSSRLIEPLSERELDVLRLLNTELSGPEIARELVVALSTVRTHTKNIYSKLNVNNRRTAVKRAIELDLI